MIIIPSLLENTHPRPNRPQFEESYLVPNMKENRIFWDNIYEYILSLKFNFPIENTIEGSINPDFGYFGSCVHPVTKESFYFNTGIALDLNSGQEIHPVLPGILEYSGYGAVNGYYVLISHPQIQTEDGYIFHTMYCHLKKPFIKFNSYEKMLREISLGSYPIKEIDSQKILGLASTTGLARDNQPGLYLQFSFRKFDQTPIVIDPLRAYSKEGNINKTATLFDQKTINEIFNKEF